MAKLTPKQIKRLEAIGIKATEEKEVRKALIAFLKKNDIEGVEEYDIDQMIEMAEVFYDDDKDIPEAEETEEEEELEEEELEEEELEEEVEEVEDEIEEVEEVEEVEDDEFVDMDRSALKRWIAKEKLSEVLIVKKSMEDEDIREMIRGHIADNAPKKEVKKEVAKPVSKPTSTSKKASSKTEEETLDEVVKEVKDKNLKPDKKVTTVAKPVAKSTGAGRKTELAGEKWDGRNDKSHTEMIKPFIKEYFNEKDFSIDILKQGITIRSLGNNAKTTVFNFDELRIVDGELVGNLYCNRFKSVDELVDKLPEDFDEEKIIGMFRGESHPCIRKVTQTEVFQIFESDVFSESLKRSNATDTRMGKNREKLEESLKTSKKK